MSFKSSSELMGEAVTRARHHWKRRLEAKTVVETIGPALPPPAAFTVAISRQSGASGTTFARRLGERLNWPVYDRELLQHIAAEAGLSEALMESIDEKHLSWLQMMLQAFSKQNSVSSAAYVAHLVKVLLSLAAHGNCVLVGRGAVQVLPPETTLRVRLVAPLAERVATVKNRFGVTGEEAARRIATTDHDRDCFIRERFQRDPADLANYDLVLNVARLSIEDCSDLVELGLKRLRDRAAAKQAAAPVPAVCGVG